MKHFIVTLLVGFWLLGPHAFADVNAKNGISITTASTINGKTPNSAFNGLTIVSGGGATEFIVATTPGATTTPSGQGGMKITVGAAPITVSELGIYGNSGHYSASIIVYIRSSGGTDLGNCSITWGTGAQWYWGTLSSPVVLSASTVYYIMTEALNFNDVYGTATTVTPTSVATVNDAAYGQPPSDEGVGSNRCTGPLNFKYTL